MKSGAAASFSVAFSTFGHRSGRTRPLRRSSPFSLASAAMNRWASSVSDISSENIATAWPWSTAAFWAMFVTSADLPIAGLAARLLELARARQLVADREGVDWLRLSLLLQADHRPEDLPVALPVEVLGLQLDVDQQAVERLLGEQDRTEDRDLCFLVLRRDVA